MALPVWATREKTNDAGSSSSRMHSRYWGDAVDEMLAKLNTAQRRGDVQEFMQIYNLDTSVSLVKVFYVYFGGNFMAECHVRRHGAKRDRQLWAYGEGRAEALEALASRVANYLHPARAEPE